MSVDCDVGVGMEAEVVNRLLKEVTIVGCLKTHPSMTVKAWLSYAYQMWDALHS